MKAAGLRLISSSQVYSLFDGEGARFLLSKELEESI